MGDLIRIDKLEKAEKENAKESQSDQGSLPVADQAYKAALAALRAESVGKTTSTDGNTKDDTSISTALNSSTIRPKKLDSNQKERVARHELTDVQQGRVERGSIYHPSDGVGFHFGDRKPAEGEMERWHKSLSDQDRAALSDPRTEVVIIATASRPGSDRLNQRLASDRGDAVQQWMTHHNVRASVKVEALGEQPAKDQGKPDGVDDAIDRAATIQIIPYVESVIYDEGDIIEGDINQVYLTERHNRIDEDIKEGRSILNMILDSPRERAREIKSMPDNPPPVAASLKGLVIKTAIGTFKDIFTSHMAGEIAVTRRYLYSSFGLGVASELDPKYQTRVPKDQHRFEFYQAGKRSVSSLSSLERYQLSVALIDIYRTDKGSEVSSLHSIYFPDKRTAEYIRKNWNGGVFTSGIILANDHPEYLYR